LTTAKQNELVALQNELAALSNSRAYQVAAPLGGGRDGTWQETKNIAPSARPPLGESPQCAISSSKLRRSLCQTAGCKKFRFDLTITATPGPPPNHRNVSSECCQRQAAKQTREGPVGEGKERRFDVKLNTYQKNSIDLQLR